MTQVRSSWKRQKWSLIYEREKPDVGWDWWSFFSGPRRQTRRSRNVYEAKLTSMILMQIMRYGGRIRNFGFLRGSGCLGVGLGVKVNSSSFNFLKTDLVSHSGESGLSGKFWSSNRGSVVVEVVEIVDKVGEVTSNAASTSMFFSTPPKTNNEKSLNRIRSLFFGVALFSLS